MHLKTLKWIGLSLICSGLSSAPVKAGLFSSITNAGKKAYCFSEYSADNLNQRTYDKAIRECGKIPDSIPWFLNAACSQALEGKLKLSTSDPNLQDCKEQAEQNELIPVVKKGKVTFEAAAANKKSSKKKKAADDDEDDEDSGKKKKKKKHKSEDDDEDESSKKVKKKKKAADEDEDDEDSSKKKKVKKKKAAEDDEEEEEEDPEKKKAEEAARKKKEAEEAARKKKEEEEKKSSCTPYLKARRVC